MNIKELAKRPDLQKHFAAGVGIWLVAHLVFPQIALVAPLIVGVAKEVVYDKLMGKGTPDITDAVATGLPGLLSLVF